MSDTRLVKPMHKPLALACTLLTFCAFSCFATVVQASDDHMLDSVPICRLLPDIKVFLKKANELPSPLNSLTPNSVITLRAQRDESAAHPLLRIELKDVQDINVLAVNHDIPIRIYTPSDQSHAKNGKLPVVMFIHGGGWTLGSVVAYDSITRELARSIPALVVSVDYRLAPEPPTQRVLTTLMTCCNGSVSILRSLEEIFRA